MMLLHNRDKLRIRPVKFQH